MSYRAAIKFSNHTGPGLLPSARHIHAQREDNLRALDRLKFSADETARIEAVLVA